MMQAKRRDPGLPNYSGMGASPREKAKFLDRVKLTILEEEHSIWPGYDLRAVLLTFQGCLAGLWPAPGGKMELQGGLPH